MDGMGKPGQGVDVTASLPVMGGSLIKGQLPSGTGVTHADVIKNMRKQFRPASLNHKDLDKYKITSLNSDVQLSERFARIEQEESDDELFFSIKDNHEITDDPSLLLSESDAIDVMQSLVPSAIRKFLNQNPEESLLLTAVQNSLDISQKNDDEEDDDSLFKSASSEMFEGWDDPDEQLRKQLEQAVAMSLMPGTTNNIQPTKSHRLDQVWQQLTSVLEKKEGAEEIKESLLLLTSQYSAVSNPEKVADMLQTQINQASSPAEGVASCQQLMSKFQLASELTEDDLSPLESLPDHDALQVLIIMRQKAVSDGADIDELEKVIQERLMQAHGEKIEAFTGFNTDEKNPDYEHYRQLQETLGTVSQAEPGWHEKSSYVDKQRDIPIKADFQDDDVNLSDEPVMQRSVEGAITKRVLEHVITAPDDTLSELVKLDSWLADDPSQENIVTNLVSRQLSDGLRQKGIALRLFNEKGDDTDLTPTPSLVSKELQSPADPKAKRRVRFEDQPDVVPRDNFTKPDGKREEVNDIVELSRNTASIEIRAYLNRLTDYMQWLEVESLAAAQHAEQNEGNFTMRGKALFDELRNYRSFAEQYRNQAANIRNTQTEYHQNLGRGNDPKSTAMQALQQRIEQAKAKSRQGRMAVLASLDRTFNEEDKTEQSQARWQKVKDLPFIKAGLVDKDKFLAFHEDQLAQMVMQTIDVSYSKVSPGQETYKLVPANEPDLEGRAHRVDTGGDKDVPPFLVPGRRKRSAPTTSDIMRAVNAASKPYNQAMEIDLENPVGFCADIADVKDPKIMLALKVRMENERCSQPMKENWEKRMKDVMREYQAHRILFCLDCEIKADLNKKHKVTPQGLPLNPEAYDRDAPGVTVAHGQKMIQEIIDGHMNYPGITDQANSGMQQVWGDMIKPAGMPENVNDVLADYMPTSDELLTQLEGEGVVSRVPRQTAAPKLPVSGANKPASEENQGVFHWLINFFS